MCKHSLFNRWNIISVKLTLYTGNCTSVYQWSEVQIIVLQQLSRSSFGSFIWFFLGIYHLNYWIYFKVFHKLFYSFNVFKRLSNTCIPSITWLNHEKIKQSLLIMKPRRKIYILYSSDTLDKMFCFRNVKYEHLRIT